MVSGAEMLSRIMALIGVMVLIVTAVDVLATRPVPTVTAYGPSDGVGSGGLRRRVGCRPGRHDVVRS